MLRKQGRTADIGRAEYRSHFPSAPARCFPRPAGRGTMSIMSVPVTDSLPELAAVVELTEGAAYADLLHAAPTEWGCVAEETACGWLLMAPPLDMLLFNRIVGCGIREPARSMELRDLLGRFREHGLRNFGVQLSPAALPSDLAAQLESEGLAVRDRWTKVHRRPGAPSAPESDVGVEQIGPERAAAFAEVSTIGFGMPAQLRPWLASTVGRPGWRHYLAWLDGAPIAAAALFVVGDVAWLGIASTLPQARRHGAQGALFARRVADATSIGCQHIITETSEQTPTRPNPSFRNMLRAGFDVVYHRPNYMLAQ
jgi:hypothetical protein